MDNFEERVRRAVADGVPMAIEDVDLDATFGGLGLESLDIVNILFGLETEFGVKIQIADFDTTAAGIEGLRLRDLAEVVKRVIARAGA